MDERWVPGGRYWNITVGFVLPEELTRNWQEASAA
jgi:hypothetical protein